MGKRILHWTYVGSQDTRIGIRVATGEGDFFAARGLAGLRATNGQLNASRVKLCTAFSHGKLECNDFRAKQVVAWSKGARNSDRRWGTRLWDVLALLSQEGKHLTKFCLVPGSARLVALLRNLEPLGTARVVGCAGTLALGHVVHNRTGVVWPLRIDKYASSACH